MNSSALSAAGGMRAWMHVFERSAASVNAAPTETPEAGAGGELIDGMVGMRLAASGVKANVAVFKAADEMLGTLLDLQA